MATEPNQFQSTRTLRPALNLGPGYHISEMLEMKGWTQGDLSNVMDFSPKHINQIIANKQPISFEMANLLGDVFDTSTQFWVNLDTEYRLRQKPETDSPSEIEQKKEIFTYFPIKEMSKRNWITQLGDLNSLKESICSFLKTSNLNFQSLSKQSIPLFRKSSAYEAYNYYAASAWFQRAKNLSSEIALPSFNKEKLETLALKVAEFTVPENGIQLFLTELEACGVIFLVLPHLPKTYLDGAAFWDGDNPTIIYTGRLKRLDNFWFTVSHEIAHVLLHLKKGMVILDDEKFSERDEIEVEANVTASSWLKHSEINNFATGTSYFSDRAIEGAAMHLDVHPCIISGCLVHKKVLNGSRLHKFNKNPIELIPSKFIKN